MRFFFGNEVFQEKDHTKDEQSVLQNWGKKKSQILSNCEGLGTLASLSQVHETSTQRENELFFLSYYTL
jgi:hypothetical protein